MLESSFKFRLSRLKLFFPISCLITELGCYNKFWPMRFKDPMDTTSTKAFLKSTAWCLPCPFYVLLSKTWNLDVMATVQQLACRFEDDSLALKRTEQKERPSVLCNFTHTKKSKVPLDFPACFCCFVVVNKRENTSLHGKFWIVGFFAFF